jgi:hypothetical protein
MTHNQALPQLFDSPEPIDLDALVIMLGQYRYRYSSEVELQEGISDALKTNAIEHKRECALGRPDRPDFLVGSLAIEVKINGSLSSLLRQISRYTKHTEISGVLVIGSPHWLPLVPGTLNEKPIRNLRLMRSML